MGYLPMELEFNILSRLPVESVIRFRCVSKTWCTIVDDPSLRQIHTNRLLAEIDHHHRSFIYKNTALIASSGNSLSFLHLGEDNRFRYGLYNDSTDLEHKYKLLSHRYSVSKSFKCSMPPPRGRKTMVVGSCNGLVCLFAITADSSCYQLCIVNPVTREYLYLPRLSNVIGKIVHGFGYSHSTNEYKAVRIYRAKDNPIDPTVEVYTLGSSKWSNISNIIGGGHLIRSLLEFISPRNGLGKLSNGALHWINNEGKIIQFDLATYKFRSIETLFIGSEFYGMSQELEVSKGMLCAVLCKRKESVRVIDVWAMQEGTWEKKLCIRTRLDEDYKFITLTNNKRKAIFCRNGTTMVSYDTSKQKYRVLLEDEKHGHCTHPQYPIIHMKSLVSLKALGESPEMYRYQWEKEEHIISKKKKKTKTKKKGTSVQQAAYYLRIRV